MSEEIKHYVTLSSVHSIFKKMLSAVFYLYVLCLPGLLIFTGGCVSDDIDDYSDLVSYQQTMANQQSRVTQSEVNSDNPLELLRSSETDLPSSDFMVDPNTGQKIVRLTVEQVIEKTLSNSPEIRVVSFDPSISKLDITKAASEFDVTAFGQLNYENEDNPLNSIYQSGQSNARTFESGVRQKITTGSEWSLSYALTRNWDDLSGRTLSTRYEPIVSFQLRQPLLRDAWKETTLAGVDIARLNYKVALLGFRQKAEEITTEVISTYWQLFQAQHELKIYESLLDQTIITLNKVKGRRQIDATEVHIKQTEAQVKSREAALIQARKHVADIQDILIRLMADSRLNLLDEFQILLSSEPSVQKDELDINRLLETTVKKNPVIQQARIGMEIADINVRVADNRDMPRLDLISSVRTQSIAAGPENAHDRLTNGDYLSYSVGLSLEYPLGNRQREAELMQRQYAKRKAAASLENVTDEATQLIKERARRIETNYAEIETQKQAVEAARVHLEVLEESELIRDRLTPEFLLLKLQTQLFLANARMAEVRAIVDYNIALAELSRIMGTVLELQLIEPIEPEIPEIQEIPEIPQMPESPDMSEHPETLESPEMTEIPETPQSPGNSEDSNISEDSDMSEYRIISE